VPLGKTEDAAAKTRLAPALKPPRAMRVWSNLEGCASTHLITSSASFRAAGKGCSGARRYCMSSTV